MNNKQQPLISHSGKTKGFIFTLDAILATFILILVLLAIHFSTSQTEDKLALIQPASTVSDAITFLGYNQTLQTQDKTLIQTTLTSLLPPSLRTRVQIQFSTNQTLIDIGEEIPTGTFVSSGKRYISLGADYAVVRFWVWHAA